jgi:hypothetical protein
MYWLVFGTFVLCGAILAIVPDTKPGDGREFVDRARLRRFGISVIAVSGTVLLSYAILYGLGNWVARDL